jgi:hypothetical protein
MIRPSPASLSAPASTPPSSARKCASWKSTRVADGAPHPELALADLSSPPATMGPAPRCRCPGRRKPRQRREGNGARSGRHSSKTWRNWPGFFLSLQYSTQRLPKTINDNNGTVIEHIVSPCSRKFSVSFIGQSSTEIVRMLSCFERHGRQWAGQILVDKGGHSAG